MDKAKRFATLEGMRGVAAACVVLMHGDKLFGAASPAGGYLAVDFFFLLSGFIMAHAYAGRLDAGLPGFVFLRARVVRLYPLYLAGSLSTVVYALAAILARDEATLWDWTNPPVSLPFALFILPAPVVGILFPLNIPAWTLFMELLANAAFAIAGLRTRRALLALMAVSGLWLIAATFAHGWLDLGWDYPTLPAGVARVFFSFPLGVLLYRVHDRVRLPAAFSIVPVLILPLLLYAAPTGLGRVMFDLGFVSVASPLLLLAAAASEPAGQAMRGTYLFLGVISYPLYALHHPSLMAFQGLILRHASGAAREVAGLVLVAAMLLGARLAAVGDHWVVRRLNARFGRRHLRAAG